jgi:hypothetical protein
MLVLLTFLQTNLPYFRDMAGHSSTPSASGLASATLDLCAERDPSEDYDKLCELCGSLNIETLLSEYGREGKVYGLSALIDTASRCKTCERIFGLESLRHVFGTHCDNIVRLSLKTLETSSGLHGTLNVVTENPPGTKNGGVCLVARHTLFTNQGDVASTRHGLPTLQAMGVNTSSDRSFKNAREWLDSCLRGHARTHQSRSEHFRTIFGEPKFETANGPARLIEVFADDHDAGSKGDKSDGRFEPDFSRLSSDEHLRDRIENSRIVDGVSICHPYTALSYCWGSHPYKGFITTKANLLARKSNIVEDELPKTFRHAIHAARRLGVRYLWIDALCIIQDSTEDWLEESGKMGSIFANALLTLVAAAGEHSEAGLFNERSTYGGFRSYPSDHDDKRIVLHTTLPGSAICSTLYLFDIDEPAWHSCRGDPPLLSRAWCLQEDLLSVRKLCYASDQLHWHCDHLVTSEDSLAESTPVRRLTKWFPPFDTIKGPGRAWHKSYTWYDSVISQDYSPRTATVATDKLIALAGLARHVATVVKSRYLAGLWEVSILEGLLWRPHKFQKHKAYCAPSWSWASQDAEVSWYPWSQRNQEILSCCEYLRADIRFLSSDEFGGVSSAALTLRSKVIELTVEAHPVHPEYGMLFRASYQGVTGWAVLDEAMSFSNIKAFAIPITYGQSLLVVEDLGSNTRRRVGMWMVPAEGQAAHTPLSHIKVLELPSEPRDCSANYLRWTEKVFPTIPVTEITIV